MTDSQLQTRKTAPREPNDGELARRAQTGDEAAIRELVERYAETVFTAALSLLDERTDVEDVVQETLLGMLRGLPRFRHQASMKTWVYSILLRQTARRHKQRRRIEAPMTDEPADPARENAGGDARIDARIDIGAALRTLSREHREVIVLREFEGLRYHEISEALHVKIGTVESRLSRARRELRRRLAAYGPQD